MESDDNVGALNMLVSTPVKYYLSFQGDNFVVVLIVVCNCCQFQCRQTVFISFTVAKWPSLGKICSLSEWYVIL